MWEKWKSRRLHCTKKKCENRMDRGGRHLRPILRSAVVITRRQAGAHAWSKQICNSLQVGWQLAACNLQLQSSITSGLSCPDKPRWTLQQHPLDLVRKLRNRCELASDSAWTRSLASPCLASLHTFYFFYFLVAQPSFMTSPASWVRCL